MSGCDPGTPKDGRRLPILRLKCIRDWSTALIGQPGGAGAEGAGGGGRGPRGGGGLASTASSPCPHPWQHRTRSNVRQGRSPLYFRFSFSSPRCPSRALLPTGRAEGVQSAAPDRVDKPPSLHASLPVLRDAAADVILSPWARSGPGTHRPAAGCAGSRGAETPGRCGPKRRPKLHISRVVQRPRLGTRRCLRLRWRYVVKMPAARALSSLEGDESG